MSHGISRFQKFILSSVFAVVLVLGSFSAFAAPVNINTASAETLVAELSGIGEIKAAAIVAYRENQGPFQSLDELVNVKGIGAKTLEKNRDNLLVE